MGPFQSKPIKIEPDHQNAINFIKARLEKSSKTSELSHSKLFSDYIKQEKYLKIIGCMFGSIIGDVLGAFCQFQHKTLSQKYLGQTMKMEGGGVFDLQMGQFTDDSELAFHLLKALKSLQTNILFKEQTNEILINISKQYVKWYQSNPFDMGITCRKGIQILQTIKDKKNKDVNIQLLLKQVNNVNNKSQSNGSLMRIAPMPIFFTLINEKPEKYRAFIENEISLIHSNDVLRQAGYIWVNIIYDLINRNDSNHQTFRKIFNEAQSKANNEQVKVWFKQSKQKDKISALEKMGWAKIAWTYGMNILYKKGESLQQQQQLNYFKQIQQVIRQGGDSDTNAAIVGGLLGAILGFDKLPYEYLKKLFSLEFPEQKSKTTHRPKIYEPLNVLKQLIELFQICKQYNCQIISKYMPKQSNP